MNLRVSLSIELECGDQRTRREYGVDWEYEDQKDAIQAVHAVLSCLLEQVALDQTSPADAPTQADLQDRKRA